MLIVHHISASMLIVHHISASMLIVHHISASMLIVHHISASMLIVHHISASMLIVHHISASMLIVHHISAHQERAAASRCWSPLMYPVRIFEDGECLAPQLRCHERSGSIQLPAGLLAISCLSTSVGALAT
jgi:hypothetical protein